MKSNDVNRRFTSPTISCIYLLRRKHVDVEYTIVSLTSGDMKKFIQVGILARDRNGEILALWGAFRQEPEESFKLHMDTSDGRHLVFA